MKFTLALPLISTLIASGRALTISQRDEYPANFDPSITSEKVITIQKPLSTVFAVLGSDQSKLCPLILLSNIASDCVLHEQDTVTVDGPLENALVREQAAGPGFPRQKYQYKETIKIIPGLPFLDVSVDLPGTNTWDEANKVVLFETSSSQGVAVVKTRFFEEVDGGAATKVTETIRVQCPWILKSIVQKQVETTQEQVTSLYPSLFE